MAGLTAVVAQSLGLLTVVGDVTGLTAFETRSGEHIYCISLDGVVWCKENFLNFVSWPPPARHFDEKIHRSLKCRARTRLPLPTPIFSCTLIISSLPMAQGNLKLKSKSKGRVTKRQSNLRAAAPLIIKPKKSAAKQAFKLKQSVGSLIGTEKLIAGRVGHLELIKGSRRQVEKEQKEADKKAARKASKA